MDAELVRGLQRVGGALDVLVVRAGERADRAVLDQPGDRLDRVEVAVRAGGEARFDHVDLHPFELLRDADLFFLRHRRAGGLFTIAQGRVENDQFVCHVGPPVGRFWILKNGGENETEFGCPRHRWRRKPRTSRREARRISAVGALVAIARIGAHQLEETRRGTGKNSSANYSEISGRVQLGFPIGTIEQDWARPSPRFGHAIRENNEKAAMRAAFRLPQ